MATQFSTNSLASLVSSYIERSSHETEVRAHKALSILHARDRQVEDLQRRIDELEGAAGRLKVDVPLLNLPPSPADTEVEDGFGSVYASDSSAHSSAVLSFRSSGGSSKGNDKLSHIPSQTPQSTVDKSSPRYLPVDARSSSAPPPPLSVVPETSSVSFFRDDNETLNSISEANYPTRTPPRSERSATFSRGASCKLPGGGHARCQHVIDELKRHNKQLQTELDASKETCDQSHAEYSAILTRVQAMVAKLYPKRHRVKVANRSSQTKSRGLLEAGVQTDPEEKSEKEDLPEKLAVEENLQLKQKLKELQEQLVEMEQEHQKQVEMQQIKLEEVKKQRITKLEALQSTWMHASREINLGVHLMVERSEKLSTSNSTGTNSAATQTEIGLAQRDLDLLPQWLLEAALNKSSCKPVNKAIEMERHGDSTTEDKLKVDVMLENEVHCRSTLADLSAPIKQRQRREERMQEKDKQIREQKETIEELSKKVTHLKEQEKQIIEKEKTIEELNKKITHLGEQEKQIREKEEFIEELNKKMADLEEHPLKEELQQKEKQIQDKAETIEELNKKVTYLEAVASLERMAKTFSKRVVDEIIESNVMHICRTVGDGNGVGAESVNRKTRSLAELSDSDNSDGETKMSPVPIQSISVKPYSMSGSSPPLPQRPSTAPEKNKSQCKKFEDDINTLKKRLNTLKNNYEEAKRKIEDQTREIENRDEYNKFFKKAMSKLQEEVESLQKELLESKQENDYLNNQLKELMGVEGKVSKQTENLRKQSVQSRLRAANQTIINLNKSIHLMKKEHDEDQDSINSLKGRLARSDACNLNRLSLIDSYKFKFHEMESKLTTVNGQNRTLKDVIESFRTQVFHLKVQITKITNQRDGYLEEVEKLKKHMTEEMGRAITDMQNRLAKGIAQKQVEEVRSYYNRQITIADQRINAAERRTHQFAIAIQTFISLVERYGQASQRLPADCEVSASRREAQALACNILNLTPDQLQGIMTETEAGGDEHRQQLLALTEYCNDMCSHELFAEDLAEFLLKVVLNRFDPDTSPDE